MINIATISQNLLESHYFTISSQSRHNLMETKLKPNRASIVRFHDRFTMVWKQSVVKGNQSIVKGNHTEDRASVETAGYFLF